MRLISSGHPSPSCFAFAEIAVSFTVINHSRACGALGVHPGTIAPGGGPAPTHGHRELLQCRFQVIRGPGAGAWESAHSLGDSETKSLPPSLGETPPPGSTVVVSFRKGLSGELSSPKTSLQFSGEGRPWGRGKLGSSLRESTSPIFCLPALPKDECRACACTSFHAAAWVSWLYFTMPVGRVPSPATPWKLSVKRLRGAWGERKEGSNCCRGNGTGLRDATAFSSFLSGGQRGSPLCSGQRGWEIKGHFWQNRHHSQGANDADRNVQSS